MSPNLPRRFGRYDVAEVIGTGAFATVFRARDARLDADVAIKVLAENHSFVPDLRERFISEGHLLRRVDDPHVVKVFDLGETDAGQPFLVLDLATGGDLVARRRALGGRDVPLADVLEVARQVAAALGALHAEHVVHRDVTPGNLLIHRGRGAAAHTGVLAAGERLMLADLGLSKDLAVASGLTVGAGTAGFTPPEQGDGGWVDPRADIWSASALLVWLASGAVPDADGAWQDQLVARGWPPGVVEELARGLEDRPTDRHPTADAWVGALREAARPAPPARAEPAEVWSAAPSRPARRRRRIVAGVLAAVLVTALVVGGWWLGRRSAEPPYGRVRTESLADGRVRAAATGFGARLSITGPGSVAVGERATFTAHATGTEAVLWLAPDGRSYQDEPTLVITPSTEGTSTVRLLGQTADGDVVVAVVDLLVVAKP